MAAKQIMLLMKPLKVFAKKKLKALFSSKGPVKPPIYSFMNITIKIDVEGPGWQKIVNKVLSGIQGVAHFDMEDDGMVTIAGIVNPPLLLKRLGKAGARATIKHWNYGQCSTNLYSVPNPYSYNHRNYYQGNNMYYPQTRGYDYPTYDGSGYNYPANRGYGYYCPRGNNHSYAQYEDDDYGYDMYRNNGYGYDRYGGSSSQYALGQEYGRYGC